MKKLKYILTALFIISAFSLFAQQLVIPGYEKEIKGESFTYHSPQDDAGEALLVRSESLNNYIQWETSVIPQDYDQEFITFNLMMAIDVTDIDPHSWMISVNERKVFNINSPSDTINKFININGYEGSKFKFKATRVDKYGDLIGYLNMEIPVSLLEKGKPANIQVVGESAQSRTWLIIYKYKTVPKFEIQPENAVFRGESGNERVVKLETVYYKEGAIAEISLGNHKATQTLKYGYNRYFVNFPAIDSDKILPYEVSIDGVIMDEGEITLKPIKPMTIYLLHHTHVDIGYTHVQQEVEEKQWSYIEKCIELAENTHGIPKDAQFKWNVEVMWALDSYWKKASPEKKARLKNAIQKGWIELDAFYGNELTGICSSEELIQLTESARRIAKECNVELKSAMISDIPGWTWGIIPTLSQSGIKYLSLGTNTFHRIGYTIEQWGDKPFYWQSASGKEKVLTWIHGKGYSSFHTGLGAENIVNKLDEGILLSYMNELRDSKYPYDMVLLRYNIGSDNGPPDATLTDKVKNWNKRYVSPKLIISTANTAFETFEKEYGSTLPIVTGDFTGYWEDGAASSAKETAINRSTAHKITQAQTLSSILGIYYNKEIYSLAWQNVLLYNEHTWGSWNSISEPHSEFTKQQWATKRQFALDGDSLAKQLINKSINNIKDEENKYIEIINTHSWPIHDIVTIPKQQVKGYNAIKNDKGEKLQSQILSNGDIVFITDNIEGYSSRKYKLIKSKAVPQLTTKSNPESFDNDFFKAEINGRTGNIKNLIWKKNNIDLIKGNSLEGLNDYIYVEGRHAEDIFKSEGININIIEEGPVLTSIQVTHYNAPGLNSLSTIYTFYNDLEKIDIINVIDKKEVYEQEGLHFSFPFNIPDGKFKYDLAYAVCELNDDQIKGSNRNFITIENWVDISNENYGITWISKDAPLIEAGNILNDPIAVGYKVKLPPTQTVISYIMNNYWETNYLAAQSGKTEFKYSIFPHLAYNPAYNERRSLELQEPLIVIPVKKKQKTDKVTLSLKNEDIIIQSIIPLDSEETYIVRFFNPGINTKNIEWNHAPSEIYSSDLDGNIIDIIKDEIKLVSMETKTVVVKL